MVDAGAPSGFRTPPHNIEAEQALLGAILINNEAYRRVADFLRPEHFHEPVHGRIFGAMGHLIGQGRLADPIILQRAFQEDEALRELDGPHYLARMARAAEAVLNAKDYGELVCDLALRRGLVRVGEEVVNAAYDPATAESGSEMLAALEQRAAQLRREAPSSELLGLTMLDDCELDTEVFWLIDDVLPRCNMAMIYSRGGGGKTYLGTSVALGLASGRWFEYDAEPGAVLYCAFERPEDAEDRLAALRDRLGYKNAPVALLKLGGKKLNHDVADLMIRRARELAEKTGKPVRAIMVDTVSAALAGAREDDEGLGLLKTLGEHIHAETNATVIWVHHEGKGDNLGPRGSLVLADGCLVWWHVEEREDGSRVVHVVKANRGPCNVPLFAFKLLPFEAGHDRRGKAIELCELQQADLDAALASKVRTHYGTTKKAADPEAGLGRRQKMLLRCFHKLMEKHPEGVDRAMLRSHFLQELNADRTRQGKDPLSGEVAGSAFRQTLSRLNGQIVEADGVFSAAV